MQFDYALRTLPASCTRSSSIFLAPKVTHGSPALTPESAGSTHSLQDLGCNAKRLDIHCSKLSTSTPVTATFSTDFAIPPDKAEKHITVDSATPRTKLFSYSSSDPETLTRSRFLFDLRGEQVYIGQAASLSFLQLAREIVSEHIGPSEFSHNGKVQTMLETTSPVTAEPSISALDVSLDVDQKLSYANTFNASLDGLMGLFAPSEIEGLLVGSHATDARYRNSYKRATVDLIIAIGAQCSSPESDINVARPFFRRAQHLAMSETLEDPNVDMIRAFLLMAFYMLGSCRRNAAFMYIGIAVRAAVVLGLHSRDSYTDMKLPRFLLRLRIWISLCNLDMTVSAILGRPAATAVLRADLDKSLEQLTTDMDGTDTGMGVLMASYKILSIISEIVDNLYGRNTIPGAFIEQYLDTIETWKHDYGVNFPDNSANDDKVTLVTRPILILTLVVQLDGIRDAWTQMARACVEASTYLVQTCVDAQDAGSLLGNMCILKALVFVAGLTLGLQSFSKLRIDYEVETAFAGARRNLEFLAVQSPQASHYVEILRLLQLAITKQRRHQAQTGRSRFVSKIYATGPDLFPSQDKPGSVGTVLTKTVATDYGVSPASLNPDVQLSQSTSPAPNAGPNIGPWTVVEPTEEIMFNWDHLDLSQMMSSIDKGVWRPLQIGVIGGGIGGLCAAVALRRSGHEVVVYERNDFAGEAGASISCAANGTRWLHEWDVDVAKGDPVVLKKLINRDWYTGEPVSVYDLADYKERWGYVYNMFHRVHMHTMLKDTALQQEGKGKPIELLLNHACKDIDLATGTIIFDNGVTATHDVIVGADGIGSVVRSLIGVHPERKPSDQSCLHANVTTEDAVRLGLFDYSQDSALEYWGGQDGKWDKIVLSPCNGGKLLSYYCFFPRAVGDYTTHSWGGSDLPLEELLAPYPELDSQVKAHLTIGKEIRPWRLWVQYVMRGLVAY
ncbi:salicylate hydroxylase [Grosmannia clavigera kw1407]|uniref:Salicylate hydroxylase n=1 Tax=Grosmannia clavigera (strain kw1407 / UAMH 11150) TaxID=655863 RepID=F0X6I1_GROCL|nr:salicylate hydroxylase [Grosmannia clavigera kw1407]EFX06708.1 salicylate hydroxylase [Grosmannia clavigera kw1407]